MEGSRAEIIDARATVAKSDFTTNDDSCTLTPTCIKLELLNDSRPFRTGPTFSRLINVLLVSEALIRTDILAG